ncbi:MAG: hypothetical protein ACYC11_02555 [Bellilinea sp.]
MKIRLTDQNVPAVLSIELTVNPYLLKIVREISSASGDSVSSDRALSSWAIYSMAVVNLSRKSDGS